MSLPRPTFLVNHVYVSLPYVRRVIVVRCRPAHLADVVTLQLCVQSRRPADAAGASRPDHRLQQWTLSVINWTVIVGLS